MGRRVMAALAAMMIGLIGVAAVLIYAKGADARAVDDQQPQTVFVAKELIPTGTTAADAETRGLMVKTKIVAKGVPAGALTQVDAPTRKLVALTDIATGEYIVASRFGTTPAAAKAITVPDGQVAISFTLSDPGRVGSFMRPGSRIVIYDTYTPVAGATPAGAKPPAGGTPPAGEGRRTQVLLSDVLVIAIGSTSLTPAPKVDGVAPADTGGSLVTVALPPATTAKLVHGIQTGTLYAGLSSANAKVDLSQIVSDATLFNK